LPEGAGGKPGPAALGGSNSCDDYKSQGGKGSDGAPGKAGAGAADWGSIQQGFFVATPGQSGFGGKVGQGGGGGGTMLDLSGIPGACGGCPGAPGQGGTAGGSSIAVLSIAAQLVIKDSDLSVGNGAPGAGGAGQMGQMGGNSSYFQPDCSGGDGGNGGDGGPGGGGAGGLSVGVLYTNGAPALNNTQVKVGLPGKGGIGMAMNSGLDGLAQDTLELPAAQHCGGDPHDCGELATSATCGAALGCGWQHTCVPGCWLATSTDACAQLSGCVWEEETCKDFGLGCDAHAV
jgi:hypothetical protein